MKKLFSIMIVMMLVMSVILVGCVIRDEQPFM